jgi:translation initiation factor IF-2
MSRIRINELARELEVKTGRILELLPQIGINEKKTHSSSITQEDADRIRALLGIEAPPPAAEPVAVTAPEKPETPAAVEVGEPHKEEAAPVAAAVSPPAAVPTVEVPEDGTGRAPAPPSAQPAAPPTPPPTAPAKVAEPPAARPAPQPLRPPLAGQARPSAPSVSAAAPPQAPSVAPPPKTVAIPARPAPPPRPGQILSGPRQPLPPGLPDVAPPAAPQPGRPMPAPPRPRPPVVKPEVPSQPGAPAQQARGPIVGQPPPRPVVLPRPELVKKLAEQGKLPGQPIPRPGLPRPAQPPAPNQPIYRGPIRPGQPIVRGPGVPGPRRHPVSPVVPNELVGPAPVAPGRRPLSKAKPAAREREIEREGELRGPVSRHAEPEPVAVNKEITISEGITVKELAEKLGLKASLVIKKLLDRKVFATINQSLDLKLAEEVASAFGATVKEMSYEEEAAAALVESAGEDQELVKRPPVVTVMGHVDHGKTSLLDAIRATRVAEREAGGITQHIGAYWVEKNGNKIVFIDTPGHEAFTRMRARGAKVTDLVVLVVAADDGVMPQTKEAIDHARAAGVPILVAINKIDRPDANPERIKQQLADLNLLAEDWGGDVVMVPVSARTGQNLDLLLEMINLVADMLELKANPKRPAEGTVLEAKLDRGRGPVATVLVRNGTLRVGDNFICGAVLGKVRALFDDRGNSVEEAGPSMPVEVLGMESVPEVGDTFQVVTDIAKARQIVMYRENKAREQALAKSGRVTLERLHEQLREGEVKELNIILKADVGGTAEVISETLQKLSNEKVRVRVLHSGVGAITESDVDLAVASDAIIVGFNVRPERSAAQLAEQERVDIRLHTVIYELTDEVKAAMAGLLEPVYREVYRGRAEVLQTFRISKVGTVAGCLVQDGTLSRDHQVRLLRDNVVVYTGRISSLKRFKDDVHEVRSGMECGVAFQNFNDVKPGDVVEAFVTERVAAEVPV